jgi:hypothetical protein
MTYCSPRRALSFFALNQGVVMADSESTGFDADVEADLRAGLKSVNDDHFVHRPDHQLVAVLDDPAGMARLTADLLSDGISLEQIRVLYGPVGRDVLDISGSRHGHWSHLVRTVQRLGYDGNTLAKYDEALKAGHVIVHVSVPKSHVAANVDLLRRHQLREISYFGSGTFEQFR